MSDSYPKDFLAHVSAEQDRLVAWIIETHARWPEYRNEIVTAHLGTVVCIVEAAGLDALQGVRAVLEQSKKKVTVQ